MFLVIGRVGPICLVGLARVWLGIIPKARQLNVPLFRIDTPDLYSVALANAIHIVRNEIAIPEGQLNDERQSQN